MRALNRYLLAPALAAVLIPVAVTRTPASTTDETLRILAYNIHHGEGMDNRLDLERIARRINETQPDLVALQEVDRGVQRTGNTDQAQILARLTGMAPVFGKFMEYQGGEYGMALLSRWPIVESFNHRLPAGAEPRSALAARVRSPHTGAEVVFVGIHLYRTEDERMAQARALAAIFADETAPVILAGDFNSTPSSPVLELLAESWTRPRKGADHLSFPSAAPDREIDFVMLRPTDRLQVVEQRLLDEPIASDHRPLFAELRLSAAARSDDVLIHGTVFADRNDNGQRDLGELGLPGVVVSNQIDAVRTADDGAYALPASAGYGYVFVSLPDGYRAHDRFYAATAELSPGGALDFALVQHDTPRDFTFMHASDPHVDEASVERLRRVGELAAGLEPAFMLVTGDLIRDALRVGEPQARSAYELYTRTIAQFPVPVWNVPGNHEIFGIERHHSLVSPEHPLYGEKMYRHYMGPNYYSFNYGGVHFVGLDTVDHTDLWYYGHVDTQQVRWLEADLALLPPGTPVVTFNHIPFFSAVMTISGYGEDPPAPTLIKLDGVSQFRHVVGNAPDLIGMLRHHGLTLALAGHHHTRETIVYETEQGPVRLHLASAVVGPAGRPELRMASGVTLYRVRDGRIDDGEFIRLDPERERASERSSSR